MIITSTNDIKGYRITEYCGLINSNIVIGANFISDWFASWTDFLGGFSNSYQSKLDEIYKKAIQELENKAASLGANAIIGLNIDFDEVSGKGKSMFMITAFGTAVKMSPLETEKDSRYDIYQKLYNLNLFKESGIITPEQYEIERDNLLLYNEEKITQDLDMIKSENEHKESIKQAIILAKQQEEEKRKKWELLQEQQKAEKAEQERQFEIEALKRKEREKDVQSAIERFKNNAPTIYVKAKGLLEDNVSSPKPILDRLHLSDIMKSNYDDMAINKSDKIIYNIGRFIKENRIAEACKFYIDMYNEQDIQYVKSYINSVYDIITLQKQPAFESKAIHLVELKYLDKIDEAIDDFMKYSVCDRETAIKVIELL